MKLAVLVVVLAGSAGVASAGQNGRAARTQPPSASASTSGADAYNQYLTARRLERDDDIDGAIAAYKRAIALDASPALARVNDRSLARRSGSQGTAVDPKATFTFAQSTAPKRSFCFIRRRRST